MAEVQKIEMERTCADAWTRVDPVFNEGTSVNSRVALQLQIMSDRVARVCFTHHFRILARASRLSAAVTPFHTVPISSSQPWTCRRLRGVVITFRGCLRPLCWRGRSVVFIPAEVGRAAE